MTEPLRALKELGVDYVQGFAIAKPQEARDILAASSAASFVTDAELTRYLKAQQTPHRGADDLRMERESAV